MTLNEITDQILAKAQAVFPNLECDHFPGDPANYQFTHPVGAVLVIYRNRQFERPQDTDGTIQVNFPRVWLSYFSRNLRITGKDPGMYDLLDAGRKGIANNNTIGNGIMWCRREFFVQQKSGVWIYSQEWELEDISISDE